jgi:hypothetical protein
MSAGQVLDTLRRLLGAAQHPDVVEIYRYPNNGEQAIGIIYRDGARAFIWPSGERARPVDLTDLGRYQARVGYVLQLLLDLLEIAQPEGWHWRTVAVEGVHNEPSALEVKAGDVVLLRVTAGGALVEEELQSKPEDWADWRIPAQTVLDAVGA